MPRRSAAGRAGDHEAGEHWRQNSGAGVIGGRGWAGKSGCRREKDGKQHKADNKGVLVHGFFWRAAILDRAGAEVKKRYDTESAIEGVGRWTNGLWFR